jgi:hypothetical protein
VKRGVKRQQFVELGGIVAGPIGRHDEDLPPFLRKRASFGNRHDNAQPDGRGGFLTFRRVHNEGHGNTLFDLRNARRRTPATSALAISVVAISIPAWSR